MKKGELEIKNIVIVSSKKDPAGVHMVNFLRKEGFDVWQVEEEIISCEDVDKLPELSKSDFIVFASKHFSSKKIKTLSIHPIGNWQKADFGGKNQTAVLTSSYVNKWVFQKLSENYEKAGLKEKGYELTMECTHHGPYISKPCFFIEVGGTMEEWNDLEAVKAVVDTIISFIREKDDILEKAEQSQWKSAIATGGLHYCQSFNAIQLNSNYAIGHVIPKYSLPISEKQIFEAIEKTIPKPKFAIIDYKGLGIAEKRDETIRLLKQADIEIIRTSDIQSR